ncbi:signal peptidase I [Sediminibacterium soli]|uniref:signal peptidase I n=1 Tax=Sediminibacterium soli TaxID=2698829 RepID=UPI001379A23F|nr:signal peptidase I [Sediminibacterium soli]NCI47093.1 signal peptidase I [Sediminibacterium soli]
MGLILFIIGTIGWHVGMYGMFKKAGIEPWKAFIPFYNTWLIVEKCQIKKVWFWLQFIPVAGQFITIWITIIFVMHFKKVSVPDHAAVVFLPFIYFPYLGFSKKEKWYGHEVLKHYHKPVSREWIDAGVFAIVAATIIRTFIFEAYVIPTGSMEKTLLVNDFLFVNKMSYGARIPQTPLSFPFVHNTLPFSKTVPSYIRQVQLPYKRLPAFSDVKRNDVVVFNFPAGDTIINLPEYGSAVTYYEVLRYRFNGDRQALFAQSAEYPILVHPMDKTDNYIKRCVGVGGDMIQVKGGTLFVNNQPAMLPPGSQTDFLVETNGTPFDENFLTDELGVDLENPSDQVRTDNSRPGIYVLNLTPSEAAKVKALPNVKSITPYSENQKGATFPADDENYPWTIDDFGPLYIPKKGDVLPLTAKTIAIYRRLITTYEHNTLEEANGKYIINGKEATSYTTKYGYYWMMGDNRHRSQDSRYWGFVPETHIVGKASLIWFSWNKGPRWKRLFNGIR